MPRLGECSAEITSCIPLHSIGYRPFTITLDGPRRTQRIASAMVNMELNIQRRDFSRFCDSGAQRAYGA